MPRRIDISLTTRLERIELLARDLSRDLRRPPQTDPLPVHYDMANAIRDDIEAVIRALKHPHRAD